MKIRDANTQSRTDASLAERLRNAKSNWHRTFADYALSFLSIFVGIGVFAVVLYAPREDAVAVAQNGTKNAAQVVSIDTALVPNGSLCAQERDWRPTKRLLVLAAQNKGGEFVPQLVALRETLTSYFGFAVQVESATDYEPDLLRDLAGLVIVGNAEFTDPALVRATLNDAHARELPVAWVGLHGAAFSDELGLTFGTSTQAAEPGNNSAQLFYNDVWISIARQPLSTRFPIALASKERTLGWAELGSAGSYPVVVVNDRRAYVGFLPFDRFNANLSLSAVIDALSHLFGRHARDPRVLFRLEDINGLTYSQGDETFRKVTDMLLAERVFLHLAIIPEVVDEDQTLTEERVLTDIGDATSVVKLVKDHPDEIAIVQHGFRHSRRDPRNSGCDGPGCAFEFFFDDDVTMGPVAAAAFARERLAAGRDILERHLGPVVAFEAPHYTMSPAQNEVAMEMYPVVLHSVEMHEGTETGIFLPWITYRGATAIGPTSVGYVKYGDPASVEEILEVLTDLAATLPDPIVVIYYHPWLAHSAEGTEDLKALVKHVRQLGYRFASICEELANR